MAPITKAADYLKEPYGRVVVPEADGTFRAEIIEFPGCIATGETAAGALASLEDVAESWLEATIAKGQRVPDPMEGGEFSGKLVVRLGKELHRRAAYMAAHQNVSLNQFIVSGVSEMIGSRIAFAGILHHMLVPNIAITYSLTEVPVMKLLPGRAAKIVSSASVTSERIDA